CFCRSALRSSIYSILCSSSPKRANWKSIRYGAFSSTRNLELNNTDGEATRKGRPRSPVRLVHTPKCVQFCAVLCNRHQMRLRPPAYAPSVDEFDLRPLAGASGFDQSCVPRLRIGLRSVQDGVPSLTLRAWDMVACRDLT